MLVNRSRGIRGVSPEEEQEGLRLEGFAEKEGFKPKMKESGGDGILIIMPVSMKVSSMTTV